MFCPKCGEKNPDEARFCGNCGAPLPVAGAGVEEAKREPERAAAAEHTRHVTSARTGSREGVAPEMKIGISIASVIFPVVGIVMGIVYLMSDSREKKSAGKLWLVIGVAMTIFYCFLAALVGY